MPASGKSWWKAIWPVLAGIIFWWVIVGHFVSNILTLFGLGPGPVLAKDDQLFQEVETDGPISCSSYRDWVITEITGPCRGFVPPSKIVVGQRFIVDGNPRVIGVIIATAKNEQKDDWFCAAAEYEQDLNFEGSAWSRTWLYIPKCKPLE